MLHLSLRGKETIIQKRDISIINIKRLGFWSSLTTSTLLCGVWDILSSVLAVSEPHTARDRKLWEVQRRTTFDFSRATHTL